MYNNCGQKTLTHLMTSALLNAYYMLEDEEGTRLKKSLPLYYHLRHKKKLKKKHKEKKHNKKNPASARPTENSKERKNTISTNYRNTLDIMPITISNKCKSGKGSHTMRSRRTSA